MKSNGRVFVFLCLLTLVASFAVAQVAHPTFAAATDAAVAYQINPTHSGNIISAGLHPPLHVKWSIDLGGTTSYPLIVNGKVYVIAGGTVSTLYALDAATGHTVWRQPVPAGYGGWVGAAYENGRIFVVPNSVPSFDEGAMFAFDANDGHQLFGITLHGQYLYTSPPTALKGAVYTSGAGSGGTVYAVREKDGKALWTANVENGDDSSPAVNTQGVFVSYVCPQSYALNPTTGQQLWHFSGTCEGGGGNTAVVYNNSVYVRDALFFDTNGLILDANTGAMTGGFNSQFAPAFFRRAAFYTEPDSLTAVDIPTGNTLWTAAPGAGDSYTSSPIVVNGVVYLGTAAGSLLGYQATNGQPAVSLNVGAPISGNEGSIPQAGLGAAEGLIVVPASTRVVALEPKQ